MEHHIVVDGTEIIALVVVFLEAMLYGILIVLSIASTVVLFRKSKISKNPINKPMIIASVSMLILATIHMAASFKGSIDVLVRHSADHPSKSKGYLGRAFTPIYVLKIIVYIAQTLAGDTFIIYRLHLVWNGDKRVTIPLSILFIASIGVGIGTAHAFSQTAPYSPVLLKDVQIWIASFFSLTLATNIISTVLIATRIWWVHRRTKDIVSGRTVLSAMIIIIESGSIYSACLIVLLALYLSGIFSRCVLVAGVTQLIGIVFSFVILRVGLGISSENKVTRTARMTTLEFRNKSETEDNREFTKLNIVQVACI